ncbi:hypothetical protein UR09_05535 [Candidatus Nitromaritima sp. SCGC AAA799-A02]|nr:hypothetical protein UR09_05535 [Candidatus Nitromaritima sp. SCGC AAA799-A02]
MSFFASRWNRLLLGGLVFVGVVSCASPATRQKAEEMSPMEGLVEVQPSGVGDRGPVVTDSKRPDGLSLTQAEFRLKAPRKKGPRFTLSARDVDVHSILMAIGKEVPQNIIIDPEVSARVTVDLKDVTLAEALESILVPNRLVYKIEKQFIRVKPQRLETRVFNLNYIISSRRGSSNLSSTSGSTSSTSSTTGSSTSTSSSTSGTGRSTSSIFSQEETNLWKEIGLGLQVIVCADDDDASRGGSGGSSGTSGSQGTTSVSLGCTVTPSQASAVAPAAEGAAAPAAATPPIDAASQSSDQPYFVMNRQAGIVIVRGYPDTLVQVAGFLEAVEGSAQRQVFIEAKIIEVTLSDEYKLGIDWSTVSPFTINNPSADDYSISNMTLTGAANFTFGLAQNSFNIVLDALGKQGNVSVLSSPKIATLNNQRAVIKVGTEDVFFTPEITPATTTTAAVTEFIPTTITIGIVLDVLPQINANGHIMMSISTSITEQTGSRTSPDNVNVVPILSVREASNVVLAQNGQTIVIGGLMKTKKDMKENAVPLLSALPIIGNLFTHESDTDEKTELVIMLTPEIMAGLAADDRYRSADRKLNQMGFTPPAGQPFSAPIKRY